MVAAEIHDGAFHRPLAIIAASRGRLAGVFLPLHHRSGVGIEKQLGAIEPQALLWIVRTVNLIAVKLSRRDAGDKDMPVGVRLIASRIERYDASGLGLIGLIEEEQLDRLGAFRKHTEIDSSRPK